MYLCVTDMSSLTLEDIDSVSEVERDTLIAIPLFIFMGIMLQRSKIAEDLLITMAQLFGPVPG